MFTNFSFSWAQVFAASKPCLQMSKHYLKMQPQWWCWSNLGAYPKLGFYRVSSADQETTESHYSNKQLHVLLLTMYMHISDMLGVVEIPLRNVWMNADTSFIQEAVGSASLWSGSISGPVCGQIWNRIQTWCMNNQWTTFPEKDSPT